MSKDYEKKLRKIANVLAEDLDLDSNGVGTISRETVEQTLPKGVTPEAFATALQHTSNLTEAGAMAVVERAGEFLRANEECQDISVSMDIADTQTSEIYVAREGDGVSLTASSMTQFHNFNIAQKLADSIALGEDEECLEEV